MGDIVLKKTRISGQTPPGDHMIQSRQPWEVSVRIPRTAKFSLAFAASCALVFVTAAPAFAASTTYSNGDLLIDFVAQSDVYTSTGGTTSIGATAWLARNESAQYGYVFASSLGYGNTTLTHGATANTRNRASWTFHYYISGTVSVRGTVHH